MPCRVRPEPFPLLARHIFAGSLQSGTGSLHPFLCGFEPGFRGLGRLPRRQSVNLHRVRLRLHDGHAPVVGDGHPALADDSLLPVAAGNGHDTSAGFRTGVDPGLTCGHRRTADHPDIRHLPGTAHHDLGRAVLGVDRIIPRTAGGILRRNDHYSVPAFLAVQGFCRSILEYRHRSDPVGRQCIYQRHLEAVDHEKRLAGFSVRRVKIRPFDADRNIFFFTFVIRKNIGGAGERPEGKPRQRQQEKHPGPCPPRRSFT